MLEQVCYPDQYFRAIVEATRLGIALLDLKGHILSSNIALQTLVGYSAEELCQKPLADLLAHPSLEAIHSASIACLCAKLGLSEQHPSTQTEIVQQNGQRISVQLTLAIGQDEHNQPQQAIVILEPLPELQSAQPHPMQRAIEPRSSENLPDPHHAVCLQNEILQSLDDVIWAADPASGQPLYISPVVERVYGYSVSSFFDNPNLWFEVIHPDDRDILKALTLTLQHMGKVSAEYRIMRPNGEIRWLYDRIWFIQEHTGRPAQLHGIISDITERKRAEAEILKALEHERQLSELKSRFVAMVTHEFRSPLSAILCATELLEHYGQNWTLTEQQEQLHNIQSAVKHMSLLLDDVLLLGKTEKESLSIQPIQLDVVKFCNNLLNSFRLTLGKRHNLCLVGNLPDRPIHLDERLLRQILTNLLSNAIKYSPQGGMVRLHLSYEGGNITFAIQDEGIGIPAKEQSHLFDFFYRATNVGTIAGTGLGLAIVKQCVDRQNGQITVTSQVGVGSTFTVTLPLSNF